MLWISKGWVITRELGSVKENLSTFNQNIFKHGLLGLIDDAYADSITIYYSFIYPPWY